MTLANQSVSSRVSNGHPKTVIHDEESPFIGEGARPSDPNFLTRDAAAMGDTQDVDMENNGTAIPATSQAGSSASQTSHSATKEATPSGEPGAASDGASRRARARPKKGLKILAPLQKDDEAYGSSRAGSPASSLDGSFKPRRNAPRLYVRVQQVMVRLSNDCADIFDTSQLRECVNTKTR